tara:strand:- start:74801 stop:74905 length:105 start_codon:yes stop_codon:yes gene_type:complete
MEIDVLSIDAVRIQPGAKTLNKFWGGAGQLDAMI